MIKLFNLSERDVIYAETKKVHSLIIYDIVKTKRRNQLCTILEGFGIRVQKSCFELLLEPSSFSSLQNKIREFYIEHEMDNIIVYPLINSNIQRFNSETITFDEDIIFI